MTSANSAKGYIIYTRCASSVNMVYKVSKCQSWIVIDCNQHPVSQVLIYLSILELILRNMTSMSLTSIAPKVLKFI